MIKIKSFYKLLYVFAHQVKEAIKNKRPFWYFFNQFPDFIFYNINNKPPIESELPWVSIPSLNEIKKIIHAEMKIFEYGSGGSTIFFAKRVKEVISVEHHKEWFESVKIYIFQKNLSNVILKFIPPDKPKDANLVRYPSLWKKEYKGFDFYDYAHSIDPYQNEYFDIIFIDGRARSCCLNVCISKLKKGGVIIFDNADRVIYQEAIKENLEKWGVSKNYGLTVAESTLSLTNIYYKPLI